MDLQLTNRIALVTGGSRGMGKIIALTLAREGADVVICGRTTETLAIAQKEMMQYGRKVYTAVLDATKPLEVSDFFSKTIRAIGRLDILVNTIGGVEKFGNFFECTDDDWTRSFELNCMTMVRFSREAVPYLRQSNTGRIMNISTVPAHQPGALNPHYSAAKAAMVNCSKHLANVLAKDNILVNAVCPGSLTGEAFERNLADRAARDDVSTGEARRRMQEEEQKKVPLQRMGTPEDVASLVAYLVSSQNQFITGTCISVDGGATRSMI